MGEWLATTLERIAQVTDHEVEEAGKDLPLMNETRDIDLRMPALNRYHRQMYTFADQTSRRADIVKQNGERCADNVERRKLALLHDLLRQETHTLFNVFMLSVQHAYRVRVLDHMIQLRRGWLICLVPNVQTTRVSRPTHEPKQPFMH